jgi:hypothetical protein
MFPQNNGRVGTYFHLFPTYTQAKKAIWDGTDYEGFKVLDHFPTDLVQSKSESELQITLKNGSIYQLIGSDNIDRIVGTNPIGCIFSEYALQNPRAWDLVRPILSENDGWAIFNTTPRGHNHAKRMYDAAVNDPAWYSSLLTVNETFRADGTPVVSQAKIDAERHGPQPMSEELIQQEYYCSFEGYQEGSYYVRQLRQARQDKRIIALPWAANAPVFTFWDIGVGDATAIWFAQYDGHFVDLIDYYEQTGEGIAHYANVLKAKPYTYARHYWPHDGRNRDFTSGETRRDTAEKLGIKPVDIVPRGDIDDGIEAARGLFSLCRFDETRCARGIDCLTEYHKERDEINETFKDKPLHNWASNGADAFRTMAMSGFRDFAISRGPIKIDTRFDPREIDNYKTDIEIDSEFAI